MTEGKVEYEKGETMTKKKNKAFEVELSNGKVVTIDPYAVSWGEYITWVDLTPEDYTKALCSVTGLTFEYFCALDAPDGRLLDNRIMAIMRNPFEENPT